MAKIMNDAAYMGFPLSIKRGNPAPVDTTAVWYNKTELETYAKSGATAYVGQILTLVADSKCEAYMISNEAGTLIKLASTTASGDLASDVATLQGQVTNLISKVGEAAEGEIAATGLYKEIADVLTVANKGVADAATAQTAAKKAQGDVDTLKTTVGADDTAGLRKRIKANETAISILQGTDTAKSARTIAAEEVAKIVDGAPESFDTLKELSDWISTHGNDATAMNSAIAKLQDIVAGIGGEGEKATVVAYVTDAITALKIGDYAKAADLTSLAARVKTLEDSPAAGITAEKIAAWDAKQDAGNYVDQTVYNTKISALEAADSKNTKAITAVKTTADAAVPKNAAAKSGTGIKVTVDDNGLVTGMAGLVKTDIPTIDQDQVDGLATALAGKQDTVTFNSTYDASTNKAATMSDIGTAKNTLVGTDKDESSVDTIKGAKKYADEKATAALGSAKEYADSIVTGTGGITARVKTLEGKVDVAKVSTAISTAKAEAIAAAATASDTKDTTLKTAILGAADYIQTVKSAYELAASKATIADVEAKDYATKTEAQGYAEAKDTAIAEAKKAGTDAMAKIGTIPEGATATTAIGYVDEKIAAIPTQTDYTVTCNTTTPEGYAKRYTLSQCGNQITSIDIPSDMVVSSGKVVENPTGQIAGTYIELTLANATKDKIYINVGDLIEYVTGAAAADGIITTSVDDNHVLTATIGNGTITKAKLATAVQTSLGKADTALQAAALEPYAKTADVEKGYVAKATGKDLIETTLIEKLKAVESGAQVNKIETIKVGGTALEITDKAVDITEISTDLLAQGTQTLVLMGGNAATLA